MTRAAVLCPHPPLLLRELGGGTDSVAELRKACLEVLAEALAARPTHVLVLGGADTAGTWEGEPDVGRFGAAGPRPSQPLPLSLGVGHRLLEEVGWRGPTEFVSLRWDAAEEAVDELADRLRDDDGLVVLLLGDGSARRGDRAPGYLDERAFPFDAATAEALAAGDARALRDLDADLARDLMVMGATAFRVLGALGRPTDARLAYDDDPFGVAYLVALWTYS